MVYYAVLAVGSFLSLYFVKSNRRLFYVLAERSVGLLNDLLTEEDDDTKLELVQKSTSQLVTTLGKMLLVLVVSMLIGLSPVLLYIWGSGTTESIDVTSVWALLAMSVGATIPFLLPTKKENTAGYSELSRLLHRLVLNNYTIGDRLFRREVKRSIRRGVISRNDFLIVSGLARSGTTSLMTQLAGMNHFSSLSYANMPFLLSPNLWGKIYKPSQNELKERSHKDGIRIGLESSEALEEYFFKVQTANAYIKESGLCTHQIDAEGYKDYLSYQGIVRRDNGKIYLAKNNNFLLRYAAMRRLNQEFVFVIMYRHPLSHAASLLEKHLQYSQMQHNEPFVLEYMDWLGHHEFGLNQKPFVFEASAAPIDGDKESLDYWLKIWINYYSHVSNIHHPRTLRVNYDEYCRQPNEVVANVLDLMGLQAPDGDISAYQNERTIDLPHSKDLLQKAVSLYDQLGTEKRPN